MKAWTARKDWINFEENPKAFQESFAAYVSMGFWYTGASTVGTLIWVLAADGSAFMLFGNLSYLFWQWVFTWVVQGWIDEAADEKAG